MPPVAALDLTAKADRIVIQIDRASEPQRKQRPWRLSTAIIFVAIATFLVLQINLAMEAHSILSDKFELSRRGIAAYDPKLVALANDNTVSFQLTPTPDANGTQIDSTETDPSDVIDGDTGAAIDIGNDTLPFHQLSIKERRTRANRFLQKHRLVIGIPSVHRSVSYLVRFIFADVFV
jgi:hypothetical protein